MSELSDELADATAAQRVRAGRQRPLPGQTKVKYEQGNVLEVEGLVVPPGVTAEKALLDFLSKTMGDDSTLVDALNLDKMSLSLLYDEHGQRQLAWIKCPVDPSRIRPAALVEQTRQFLESVKGRRPRKPPAKVMPKDRLWAVNDLQLGKQAQAFGGLDATLRRADWIIDEVMPSLDKVDKTWIALLGDLTEGCAGSYPHQQYSTVLNTAEQYRAALELLIRWTERALDTSTEVEITGVGSNHDQNMRGTGKDTLTDDWDDRTFMLMDALAAAFRNDDRVTVTVPHDPLVVAVDIRGLTVAMTHGHKMQGKGGDAVTKVNHWWREQIASRVGPAAAAHVLIAAHFHHFYLMREGNRLLVGTPSPDGGSQYLQTGKGVWATPGFVSVDFDDIGVREPVLHTWPEDRQRAWDRLGLVIP